MAAPLRAAGSALASFAYRSVTLTRYALRMRMEEQLPPNEARSRTTTSVDQAAGEGRSCSTRGAHVALFLLLVGCGGRAGDVAAHRAAPHASDASARAPGELSMRDPDALASPASQPLGALVQTAGSYEAKSRPTQARETPLSIAAIRLAPHPKPRPYPLQRGELVLPSGLVVHRVPKGISVRSGREQQTADMVWEIADARGRRLALIKERSFRRAAASTTPVIEQTATVRLEEKRGDWDDSPVRVIVDRFHADDHIYTLERRARGTGWIMSNLELAERSDERTRRRD